LPFIARELSLALAIVLLNRNIILEG